LMAKWVRITVWKPSVATGLQPDVTKPEGSSDMRSGTIDI